MRLGRVVTRGLLVVILVPVLLLGALLLWPEAPPRATGAWMQRAGVAPRSVRAAGLNIRYVRRGSGPALVLVHGLASSIYTWAEVLPRLAERYDVVAVDLPGFGGSDIPARLDTATVGRLLPEVMDALGLARASLAGNSLGGAVAAVTAARHPDRVDRLVLIDAAAYNFKSADRPPLLRAMARAPAGLVRALPQRPLMRGGLEQVFYDDTLVTDERVEEYLAPMARPGAREAARALLTQGDDFGLPGVLRQVRAPTLVIWGRQDEWIPVAHADLFVRDIPGARAVILDRCGHVPQEERPQEVARLIDEFLRSPAR
jgi:pimeloyl-ACP methyl ester carboxylesterase